MDVQTGVSLENKIKMSKLYFLKENLSIGHQNRMRKNQMKPIRIGCYRRNEYVDR